MNKNKSVPVSFLNPGDKFKFANFSNYRNCKVKRNSDSGTWCSGEVRQEKDQAWKLLPLGYVISNSSEVILID